MLGWIKPTVVGIVLASIVGWHYYAVNEARAEVKQRYEQIINDSNNKAKAKVELIALQSKALEKIKDEQIKALDYRVGSLLVELRTRPSRPADILTITEVRSSCTGRELYREDGEFLAREASRAEKVLTERNYWYEQYESARKELEKK